MENTHDALQVKCLQKSIPGILLILILTMPDAERAEYFKSCRTVSLLINWRPNDSSNIHALWYEEPLGI